jgi:hypothetical protein
MLQGLDMDSNSVATLVTACATPVYGIGTIFLVYQLWRDRVQRDRHFQTDSDAQKLTELRRAFCEAYGYWLAKGIVTVPDYGILCDVSFLCPSQLDMVRFHQLFQRFSKTVHAGL